MRTVVLKIGIAMALAAACPAQVVEESARELVVAYDADVAVIGGTTGAVEAAVAAAKAGARVFLAAPRPYLGEDVCATLRLFLHKDETPGTALAAKVFDASAPLAADVLPSLPFTLKPPPGERKGGEAVARLNDGVTGANAAVSVQYDRDVELELRLAKKGLIAEVVVAAFYREGDFEPGRIFVETSEGVAKKKWVARGSAAFGAPKQDGGDQLLLARVPVGAEARVARVRVERAPGSRRLLLSEIALTPPEGGTRPAPDAEFRGPFAPLGIKKALDAALLGAGVEFLYSCLPTEVARDADGRVAGVVIAGRTGRQLVRAGVVIDATEFATVARLAGAAFEPFAAGERAFEFVTMGGGLPKAAGVASRRTGLAFPTPGANGELVVHTVRVPMRDGSWRSFAEAEQAVRDRVYDAGQSQNTEAARLVAPEPMRAARRQLVVARSAGEFDLEAFRAAGPAAGIFVLGERADVPREAAALLARPTTLMEVGARLGRLAAAEALRGRAGRGAARVEGAAPCPAPGTAVPGDTRELLEGPRAVNGALPKVAAPAGGLPVLAEVDVAVVGGGTSGSPAAIVAAREGMRTLEVEYQHMLGGVGTVGLVAKYWHTYTKGFPESIPGSKGYWDTRERSEWLRTEFRKAGGELWYGCVGAGAFMEGNAVKGVVVATPLGRGVVLAKRVIDGTGNADVAAAAGAETSRPGAGQVAVQGTGLPPVRLGGRDFINTDWTIVDDNDLVDMWRAHLYARLKFADAFDTAPFINSRERRRIVSDYDLTIVDELNGRTFPDTVVLSHTNLDQHGFSVARLLELSHPDRRTKMTVRLPYRVMLPRGVENLLVIGLGMGVEHDALPLVRLQATLIHQGVAAAVAAAQSIRAGAGLRQTDIRAVQRRLVELGGLPEEITGETDSYPLSDAALEAAARALPETPSAAAALFTDPARARPLLRKALAEAPGAKERFAYARALGLLDDPAGRAVLMEFLKDNGWDEAWNYRGMGNFGATLSVMDSVILTLGRLGVAEAAPLILEKAARLEPGKAFSHYRAVCLALEALRDTRAVPVLEKLLKAPGAGGHAVTDIRRAAEAVVPNPNSAAARRDSTVECYLARALLACGDTPDGLGRKTLETYARDLRGYWARFAADALESHGRR